MPNRLEQWIAFLGTDRETAAVLTRALPQIEPHLDGILDTFYARVAESRSATALFSSPESLGRAREAQKHHWLTYVLRGRFDLQYLRAARAIGQTHYKVGVDLMFFTGGYSIVLSELVALVTRLYQDRPQEMEPLLRAINKAIFLDMGLATSVYYDSFITALENMSNELNFSLARAGEFRDHETGAHLMRVSRMCQLLASAIGKDKKWAQTILIASPLHDVGKIGIPDHVLLKPGRLDATEIDVMQRHTTIGGEIIPDHPAEVIRMAKRIALTHHERWDGSGYPVGLRGEEIPVEGRIVAICDVYDALLSVRPYKEAWAKEDAVAYIRENRGRHFDPVLADTFLGLIPEMDAIRARFAETSPSEPRMLSA